jgi:hypothetical protein
MSYLDKLSKNIKIKKRKRKGDSVNSFIVFAAIGVTIGGAIAGVFARKYIDEIKNIISNNAKDIDEDINIKRDEIKQTLEKDDGKSVGDVGVAMEKALEDLEDEQYNENEGTK